MRDPMNDHTQTLPPREPSPAPLRAEGSGARPVTPELGTGSIAGTRDDLSAGLPTDDPERYELVGEHARGGLGRIVRAIDRRLGRTVAVKELLKQSDHTESLFLREALITARLQHPGIVPVHEAGRWPGGSPFYVMKLVQGRTLKEIIADHATLSSRLSLLPHVIAVADAIGYAHSEHVIHRDLKPANVVIGAFGETVVVDWGLARDGTETPTLAASKEVIGTPAYMAPEQARAEDVDARADVYALGCMLYEVLAGVPPYAGTTPQQIVDSVIAGPPAPLCSVMAGVPSDLEAIVAKAMARDPKDRSPEGSALADDLRRFHTGQLVRAHTYGTMALLRRWVTRHRGTVAMASVGLIALSITGAISVQRIVNERNRARSEEVHATAARAAAEQRQFELTRVEATSSLRNDPTAAVAWLKAYPNAAADTPDLAGERAAVLADATAQGVARHVLRQREWVFDATFSPDGRELLTASADGVLRAYDVATGHAREIGRQPHAIQTATYSPDGRWVVTGGALGDVRVWPRAGGDARLVAQGNGAMVERVRWSPDSASVLVERARRPPEIMPIADSSTTGHTVIALPGDVSTVAIAQDDWRRLAYVSASGDVTVRIAGSERRVARLGQHIAALAIDNAGTQVIAHDGTTLWRIAIAADGSASSPLALATTAVAPTWLTFSSDGKQIAVGGDSHDIVVVDIGSKTSHVLRGHTDAVYGAEFSHDGTRLLSASDDSTARLWELPTGDSRVLLGHDDDVYRAHFSPDESWVATASLDRSARIWPAHIIASRVLGPAPGAIMKMKLSADDRTLVTTGPGFATRWQLDAGLQTVVQAPAHATQSDEYIPSISADGDMLAIRRDDHAIEVVRADGTRVMLRGHAATITGGGITDDHQHMFTSSNDGTLRKWNLADGAGTVVFTSPTPIVAMALSRSGRVVFHTGDALAELTDGGSKILATGAAACVDMLAFEVAPSLQQRLVLMRCDGSMALQGSDGNTVELAVNGYRPVNYHFSPDGTQMVGSMDDRTVRIWDTRSGALLQVLRGHDDLVFDAEFSPDGQRIASASHDRTIRVWELSNGRSHVLRGHWASVDAVAWTHDGTHIVSGSRDGTVRIWPAPSVGTPAASELTAQLAAATSAVIGEDNRPATL